MVPTIDSVTARSMGNERGLKSRRVTVRLPEKWFLTETAAAGHTLQSLRET